MFTSEIITYGGGETLKHVFNAVAMLMNGKSGALYHPLMLIGATVGAVWAFGKAFWESSFNGLFYQWFIPMIAILAVCAIPTSKVHIHDPILNVRHVVDHVPLGLARTAQTISAIGHGITKGVEQAFAVPGHHSYSKTGMIFGSENLLEMSQYAITNEKLLASMRDFVHNCVTFDLTFELYTMDELKNAPNIWELISNRTSQVRMFTYCDPKQRRCQLVSCQEGAKKYLDPLFKDHCRMLNQHHVLQHLPMFYQQLTGMARNAINAIEQQVMMHTIIDATERKCDASGLGTNFAVRRAYMQQRRNYEVVGALAAKSLVVLRNIFEALIYVAFIFIMPFAMIPQGFRIFGKWLWLLIWIQLWPPFYAILNSGIMMAAHTSAKGITGIDHGLTFANSTGLYNLALDMETYAAYASLSVPFIAYAILQGGVSALVQMSSSLTGVSQSAGASAAAEQVSGNYTYGQIGLDTVSAFNRNMNKIDQSSNYASGFYTENTGTHNYTVDKDGKMVVNSQQSQLDINANIGDQVASNLTRASNTAYTHAEKEGQAYVKSMAERNVHGADLVEHMSKGGRYDHAIVHGKTQSVSENSAKLMEQAASFGKQYGWSAKTSCAVLAGVGAGLGVNGGIGHISAEVKGTLSRGTDESEIVSKATAFNEKTNFSENYQKQLSAITNENVNFHDEQGKRLALSCNSTFEKAKQHQAQSEAHKQKADMLSTMTQDMHQKSVSVNRNLNNEFIEYLKDEKLAGGRTRGLAAARMVAITSSPERDQALDRFVNMKTQQYIDRHADLSTQAGFEKASENFMNQNVRVVHDIEHAQSDDKQINHHFRNLYNQHKKTHMQGAKNIYAQRDRIVEKNQEIYRKNSENLNKSLVLTQKSKHLIGTVESLSKRGMSWWSVLRGKVVTKTPVMEQSEKQVPASVPKN